MGSCAERAVERAAAKATKCYDRSYSARKDINICLKDYGMQFYAVYVSDLGSGGFHGIQMELDFYLDGGAGKALEYEAKSLVYMHLAELLEEEGLQTQSFLLTGTLSLRPTCKQVDVDSK